jgi:hypothetical protein
MDGIEVHNPYRLSGLASAFNPESVERFELMAGAFDVRYGDRLSSILVVSNRAGRADVDLGGAASLALTDASLLLEGGFPGSGDGSWLVAARRTYYDLVAERFVDARLPAFSEDYAILTRGRNRVAALRWSRSIGSRGHLVASGGHTYFREGLDFRGVIESSSRRSNGGEASSRLAEVLFVRDVSVGDLAARVDTTWRLSRRAQLDAGIEAHRLRPAWNYDVGGVTLDAQRNGTRLPYPSGLAGAGLPDELDSALGYGRGAAYVQQQVQLGRTRLRLGVRLDRSGLNRRTSLQPRAGADVRLGPRLAFELGAGVYAQTPGYEKTFQADDFLDLGEARGLDNERALHASAAIAWRPAPGLELRAEAFGRRFEQLLVGRLETEAESRARIARYDFPPFPAWIRNEIPRRPVLTVHPTLDGRGEAWGVDAILSRRAVAGRDRLTGWLAYTWSRAEREAWGRRFPFDYDRRHALSLVGNWRPSRALALGATLRAASGFPYTPAVGARLAAEPDIGDGDGDGDTEELLPARDARGEPVFQADYGDVTNRNRARLPAYFRLDARLTYRPGGQRSRLALYLDVINLTGRANAGQIESALVRDPGADRPRVEERREVAVPFLPSLGVHWRF